MSGIKDGGPAFPVECYMGDDQPRGVQTSAVSGMVTGLSIRDYFAAKALNGLLASTDEKSEWPSTAILATSCYVWADAMLKARAA